jgi:DNA polymerase I-like protein with 3'-5' exonuclease and polymerase domains
VNTEDLGEFFTTWGGRRYFCEPKMTIMKRPKDGQGNEYGEAVPTEITFEYKMVNALIQGSAADCTKEAIIRYDRELKRLGITTHYLILLVHDELVVSMPKAELAWGIQLLRRCMESVSEETGRGPEPFEVKILSEGVFSTENWGAMKPYDTKGKIIANLNGLPKQKKAA